MTTMTVQQPFGADLNEFYRNVIENGSTSGTSERYSFHTPGEISSVTFRGTATPQYDPNGIPLPPIFGICTSIEFTTSATDVFGNTDIIRYATITGFSIQARTILAAAAVSLEAVLDLLGNITFNGGAGADRIVLGKGNDTIIAGAGNDYVSAGAGNDYVRLGDGNDVAYGGKGNDTLEGWSGNDTLYGGGGDDTLYGNSGKDKLYGDNGNDVIWAAEDDDYANGGAGNDTIYGGSGNDRLLGEAGNDKLNGGLGADKLTGGAGADTFIFTSIAESTVATAGRDTITDFSRSQKDKINLKAIDANVNAAGDQAFKFIGTNKFSSKAGELRYQEKSGKTYVYGDVNGDGKADFSIMLDGKFAMIKEDFVL